MTSLRILGAKGERKSVQSFAVPQVFLGSLAHARAIGTRPFLLQGPGYEANLGCACHVENLEGCACSKFAFYSLGSKLSRKTCCHCI